MSKWVFEEFNQNTDIGVIGAGYVAKEFHLPILYNLPDASISYIADVDEGRANRLASHYSCPAIEIDDTGSLPQCDAVLLAIPVGVRSEYISEFGKRDTPIFSEKPFATNLNMHQSILENTDMTMCNYMRTLYAPTRQARQILESDLFGELQRVEIFEEKIGATGKGKNHYQTDPAKGGGILLETGVHSLSQLMYLFSDWEWTIDSTDIIREGGLDVDVCSRMRLEKGSRNVETVYRLSRIKPVGTKARLVFDTCELIFDPGNPSANISVKPRHSQDSKQSLSLNDDWPTSMMQAIYVRWRQFLRLLNGGAPDDIGIITGKELTRLVDGMYDKGDI